jgi:hypothetical protein
VSAAKNAPGPWEVKPLVDFSSGRPAGFIVQRVHNAYTVSARVETLTDERGRNVFRTESTARAAMDAATGGAQ